MREYLVELTVWDSDTASTTVLRYSTHGRTTTPSDAPANAYYAARLRQPVLLGRHAFREGASFGRSRSGLGELELMNGDGELDALLDYGFDGRGFAIKVGEHTAAYSTFEERLTGTMVNVEFEQDTVRIWLRDASVDLDVPLQPNKYAGDNVLPDGLEGTGDDLQGKPKPVCLGTVKNVPAPCVNTAKLIYQVNDGAIEDVDAVYDRGIALGITPYDLAAVTHGHGDFSGRGVAEDGAGHIVAGGGDFSLGYEGWILHGDGDTWSKVTPALFANHYIESLAFGAGVFLAVGSQRNGVAAAPAIATSADFGATWTTRTAPGSWTTADNFITSARWLEGVDRFCIMTRTGKVAMSPDGITWTDAGLATGDDLWDSATDETDIIVVGETGGIGVVYRSTDAGVSFTLATPVNLSATASGALQAIYYSLGMWVLAGLDGSVATVWSSEDGTTWVQRIKTTVAENVFDLYYSDGFWACGSSSLNLISRDGYVWVTDTPPTNYAGGFAQIVFDGRWWFVGEHTFSPDGGIAASPAPIQYADEADLLNDDLAPPPGSFGYWAAGGHLRLGSSPDGLITADVTQGASATDRTPAALFRALLNRSWVTGGLLGQWDEDDLDDLDTAIDGECGFWTDSEMTVATAVDQVAMSAGAFWGPDRTSVQRIKQLAAPSGSAVLSLSEDQVIGLLRVPPADGRGLPSHRSIVRWGRFYAVQPTDVAGGVSDARRGQLAKPWREALAEDADVLEAHPLALQTVEDSLLATEAEAQGEATRRQALRGTRRDTFRFKVDLNEDTEALELLDVIDLTHSRYGLSSGELCRVIGTEPDARAGKITLTAWR